MVLGDLSARAGESTISKLSVPLEGKAGFTLIEPAKSGVQFTNVLSEMARMTNANLMNGSGVALGDVDGDGLCDIYLCSMAGQSRLYKNLGNWAFKDVTEEAGVACAGQVSTGAMFADLDGDGDLDLLVTSMGGPNACFINDGTGHFANRTADAGLVSNWGSSSMALADIDGNGTLDLYVCNYGATSIMRSGGNLSVGKNAKGEPVVLGRNAKRLKIINGVMYELGEPDILYLNDGHAHFTPVKWSERFVDDKGEPVAEAPWDQGLSVTIRDLNGDGTPDIYVCNDALMPDRIWLNDGHGKFRAAPGSAIRKTSYFCMGVDVGDLDRDGHDDILTVDMLSRSHAKRMTQRSVMHAQPNAPGDLAARFQVRRNVLLWGDGLGNFTETANYSGLAASDWTWSCVFMDVDLDGWEDVLVSNGFEHDVDDADVTAEIDKMGKLGTAAMRRTLLKFPRLETPNYAFRNLRNRKFEEVGADWGFNSLAIGNGMALADLDNDGDLDVVVNCMNSAAVLYRNNSAAARVAVRLKGAAPNTQGIGARITVTGGPVAQSQVMMAGGRYVSSDQAERVFAAGAATNLLAVKVTWPSGNVSELAGVAANSRCEISESTSAKPVNLAKAVEAGILENQSALLGHVHEEGDFDDFARQPSLPRKFSQMGPVLAALDLNHDGFDDLIIGAGKGGRGAVFMNDHGALKREKSSPWERPARADDAAILAFGKTDEITVVLRAESNFEEANPTNSLIHVYEVVANQWREVQTINVPGVTISSLAVADIDGDNSLEVFVGGRGCAGEYPKAGSSYVLRYDGKSFRVDAALSEMFRDLGLVTGAIFSDLNGDGFPDLVLSLEWGPIRVFMNSKGAFKELAFGAPTGLWTFVTTGDFDGDGLPDIVGGNWGLNSVYLGRPALFYGDLNDDGQTAVFEAYGEGDRMLPLYDLVTNAKMFPWLSAAFPTHAAFARAKVEEILGSKKTSRLTADSLESAIFLNRTNRFERKALPAEAQFSPAMGAAAADFDGDGLEDIFVAQNFFGVRPDAERLDAGRGLLLRGNGAGGFVVDSRGVDILGQQSSPVQADFRANGKMDLVVGQNSAATQLFLNRTAATGFRVRLRGPVGNPDGIGASIRLKTADGYGPVQEVRCVSGPIGEESAVKVFSIRTEPISIRVTWPGGKVSEYPVPAGATSMEVDSRAGGT